MAISLVSKDVYATIEFKDSSSHTYWDIIDYNSKKLSLSKTDRLKEILSKTSSYVRNNYISISFHTRAERFQEK